MCAIQALVTKKQVSLNVMGNERQSALQGLNIWNSVMDDSPMINPLERRLLRTVAMTMLVQDPIADIGDFPIEILHVPLLGRLWSVIVSSLRNSHFEFKHFIRPKTDQILKQHLEDMVAMARMSVPFQRTAPSRSIISTLRNAAAEIAPSLLGCVRVQTETVQTTTTTTVELLPLSNNQNIAQSSRVELLNDASENDEIVRQPASGQVSNQFLEPLSAVQISAAAAHEKTTEDFICDLVKGELAQGVRVRWSHHVAPAYNRVAAECNWPAMSVEDIKRRWKQRSKSVDQSVPQASVIEAHAISTLEAGLTCELTQQRTSVRATQSTVSNTEQSMSEPTHVPVLPVTQKEPITEDVIINNLVMKELSQRVRVRWLHQVAPAYAEEATKQGLPAMTAGQIQSRWKYLSLRNGQSEANILESVSVEENPHQEEHENAILFLMKNQMLTVCLQHTWKK